MVLKRKKTERTCDNYTVDRHVNWNCSSTLSLCLCTFLENICLLSEGVEMRCNDLMSKLRDVRLAKDSAQHNPPIPSLFPRAFAVRCNLYKNVRCATSRNLTNLILDCIISTMRAFLLLNVAAIAGLSSIPGALAWGAAGTSVSLLSTLSRRDTLYQATRSSQQSPSHT